MVARTVLKNFSFPGHILAALTCGQPVDLGRLCLEAGKVDSCSGAPSKTSWNKVVEALKAEGVDPVAQATYQKADILKIILPVEGTKDFKDRTPLVSATDGAEILLGIAGVIPLSHAL